MDSKVIIYTGHTAARIMIPPQWQRGGWVIRNAIDRNLTEHSWDPRFRRVIVLRKFCYYDFKYNSLNVPINFLGIFQEAMENIGVEVEARPLPDYKPRAIKLKMDKKFTDRPHQVDAIKYLSDPSIDRKGLSLQPGAGKTYSSTKAIVNLGHAAVIVVAGLVDQWVKSIREQTNIGEECYVIQGFDSLKMLTDSTWKPKIFVCSLATMRLYAGGKENYKELKYDFPMFFQHYGIGTKVYDEVHRDFYATTMMDMRLNVQNNIYLTATFTQSSREARRIFNVVYPTTMRFGEDRYKRYVSVFMYGFHGQVLERKVTRFKGYSHAKYEGELLKKPTKFDFFIKTIMYPRIVSHYINVKKSHQKLLIFVMTLQMVDALKKELQKLFPDLKVTEYIHGSPRSNLDDGNDIILTVPQKGGTGLDIKNLKTAYNTISTRAPTAIEQWLGRLRELDNNEELIYIDQYDINIDACKRHVAERREILKNKAKDYHEHVINYI